ncbi:MAG: HYR domain-containing protein, partial [Flavobacteriaceae bacterium]|nr:HYR domain-containing protein [Flavobacteriaceae bacterium]
TTTDNCTDVTLSQVPAPGTVVGIGTTTIVLTATDGASNTATCNFDVLVFETTNPIITCPEDQEESVDANCNFTLPDYTSLATTTDNCTDVTVSQVPAPGTIVETGTTTIVLTATNGASNTATCNFDVLVSDNTNPTITCPEDQGGSFYGGCNFSLPDYTYLATATDNCTDVTLSQVPAPGTIVGIGSTTIVLTATDGASNTATCNFDVLVFDTINPTIICPEDQEGTANASCFTLPDYTSLATTTDNCTDVTLSQVPAPGTIVETGTTTIVLTATDGSSNTATCNFDVLVSDNTNPTITCPEDQEGLVDESCNFTLPNYTSLATTADNCTVVTVTQVPAPGTIVGIGSTTIVLTATDGSSNTATCNFDVLVSDTTNPIITCPEDQEESVDSNCNFTLPDYTSLATAADNCTVVTVTQLPVAGTIVDLGSTTIVLTATDGASNTATCNFDVLVSDNTNPTITCPEDQEESVDANCNFTLPDYTSLATVADNCTDVTVSQVPAPGTVVGIGSTTIVLTVDDGNGQTATCTTVITVEDNEDPVITCAPDGTRDTDPGLDQYTLVGTEFDATFTDNCTSGSITNDLNGLASIAGVILPKGATTVIWTVDDGNGQTATCTTVITVEDNEDPVITCAPDGTRDTDPGLDQYTVVGTEFDATFTDNCPDGSITNDMNGTDTITGEILVPGVITVVWTVIDGNGQTAICATVITVEDNEAPVALCQDITVLLDQNGQATISANYLDGGSTDNVGIISFEIDIDTFLCDNIGEVSVTLTVADASGNTDTCIAVVSVIDTINPVIVCPVDITVDPGAGNLYYEVPDYFATGEASAVDNCTDPLTILSQDPAAGTLLPDGIYPVTMMAIDEYGNMGTCTFILTIESMLGKTDVELNIGSIVMHPNPSKDMFILSNPQAIALQQVVIYDYTGRLIQTINLSDMGTQKMIDVSQLATAPYMVVIQSEKGQITKLLIKE